MAMKVFRLTRWFVATLALTIGVAQAQVPPEWRNCTGNPDVEWDQQIASCTTLIQSGKESNENTGIAYYNRGLAYENKGDYPRAIADYSEAIQRNPYDADAYFFRSLDKARLSDKEGAAADMAAAKRINPNIGRQIGDND
jgi:tetratricopeptide (TPR) repeat protein